MMMRTRFIRQWLVLLTMLVSVAILSACSASAVTPVATPLPPVTTPIPVPATTAPTSTPAALPPTAPPSATLAISESTAAPSGGGEPSATPATLASPTATAANAGATGTPPSEVTIQEDNVVYGPGDFDLPDPSAGLSELASYEAVLTVQFDGTINGAPSKSSRTYVMTVNKEPPARRLTFQETRGATKPAPTFVAELDGTIYQMTGDKCRARELTGTSPLADQYEPASFLDGVIGAEKKDSQSVNGVATDHYTFDERALGEDGLDRASGELWVASQGGYVVKYQLTRTGQEDYFGDGISGTETTDYALTVSAKPAVIELPSDCPPGMVHAPVLPDASNTVRSLGNLSYDTAAPLADAAAFYQEELPKQGWAVTSDPVIGKTGALLSYRQGKQDLTVILAAKEGGGTTVNINQSPVRP